MNFHEVLRLAKEWAALGDMETANKLFKLIGLL